MRSPLAFADAACLAVVAGNVISKEIQIGKLIVKAHQEKELRKSSE